MIFYRTLMTTDVNSTLSRIISGLKSMCAKHNLTSDDTTGICISCGGPFYWNFLALCRRRRLQRRRRSSVEQRGGWGCWKTMRVHGAGNVAQSAIRSVSERVDKERSDWQSTEQLLIVLWAKLQAGALCAERCRLTTSPPPKLRNADCDFVTKHNRIH